VSRGGILNPEYSMRPKIPCYDNYLKESSLKSGPITEIDLEILSRVT
jgi:hypothetical protein